MRTHEATDEELAEGVEARGVAGSSLAAVDERLPIDVDHAPPRLSQGIALVAISIGALLTTVFSMLALPFGIAGVALIAGSLFTTYSRTWLTVGTALVLVGAIVTGAYGAVSPELMLVGVGATVLAWDVGQHGIVLGEQLGRRTRSTRNLVVHTTSTTVVIGFISAMGYLGYVIAGGGRHASAVAVAILGLILIAWVFRA